MFTIENISTEKNYKYESMLYTTIADVNKQLTVIGCLDIPAESTESDAGNVILKTNTKKGDAIIVRRFDIYGVKGGRYAQPYVKRIIEKVCRIGNIMALSKILTVSEVYFKRFSD